jgi:16S rRNA (guanine527-N7)-methyltransferase
VIDQHLADSLVALELECVRSASSTVDIGSGAGLPGLPLAIALPSCAFALLESSARKCAFIERAAHVCNVPNVEVVHARAETWSEGLGRLDIALARAVGRLDVVLEYAAPLLAPGGTFIAWRGRRVAGVEAEGDAAAEVLGLQAKEVRRVEPFSAAEHRHLHLFLKVRATPSGFPRRPGAAAKRPLGA